ncbi:MAG: hypothetical protein ACXW30_02015 [Micavibrio sp.]
MEENKGLKNIGSSEIQDIKDDLQSLRSNVVTLAQDIKNGGGAVAREGVDHLKSIGQYEFQKVEDHVREKPGQSLALAFCAGLVFSYLIGGRR